MREEKHEGKIVMKCIYCETHKAIVQWGIGTGFSTLQHDSIVIRASSSTHKLSQENGFVEMRGKQNIL